jgi:hypothetical protein
MKNRIQILVLATAALFMFSCRTSKKTSAGTSTPVALKNDAPSPHLPVKKSKAIVEKSNGSELTKEKVFVPLPPEIVTQKFRSSYATASDVVWTKKVAVANSDQPENINYKVIFILLDKTNSAIYKADGALIESRMQIMPDQLPSNVYAAIKQKYPDYTIISAFTVKSMAHKGAYAAYIKTETMSATKEIIIADTGSFVE